MEKLSLKNNKIIRTPATLKQKKAMKALVENGGSMRDAMRKAGYSEAMIKTPSKLTRSKNWTELLEEFLPNEYMMEKHKLLFEQKQINYFSFPVFLTDSEIQDHMEANGLRVVTIRTSEKAKLAFYATPDTNAIKSALDIAHKLKGNYAAQKLEQTIKEAPPVITGMRIVIEK
jgi:hypothetical protein